MRHAIIITIMIGNLFVCSLAIATNWHPIFEDDEKTVYIETDNIRIQGDEVSYWEKWVYKNPQGEGGILFISRLAHSTSDCKERTSGITQLVAYDKDGDVVFSFYYPLDMKPVVPDSIGETTLDKACQIKLIKKNQQKNLKKQKEAKQK